MKKTFFLTTVAMLVAVLVAPLNATAQSKRVVKEAKKETKALVKEGFKSMGRPIDRQIEDYLTRIDQTAEDGTAKYYEGNNVSVAGTYAAAQMAATNIAKVRLAEKVESTIMAQAKIEIANAQLNAEEAASITKAIEKSTTMVAQKLNNIIVAKEFYRILENKNYEVQVVLLYDRQAAKELAVKEAKDDLRKSLDNFKPEYEKVLDAVNQNAK